MLKNKPNQMATPESLAHGTGFMPKPDDVFVTTYPKCGTTWTTQICQVLRSNGDINFGEITEVIPWDMVAYDCKQNLDDEQTYHPRVFKSHFTWEKIAKGGKYIHVVRNPVSVLKSFYPFFLGFTHQSAEDIPFSTFFEGIFMNNTQGFGRVFEFYTTYLKGDMAGEGNILWVFYEDMQENPAHEIKRIAKFMGLDKTLAPEELAERCELAEAMSSKEFMIQHDSKFNGHFVFNHKKKALIGEGAEKLTKPKVSKVNNNKKETLTKEMQRQIDESWTNIVTKEYGFTSYEDMRNKLAR